MPPAKRTTAPQARRSKRLRTDLSEAGPSSVVANPPMPPQQTGQGGEIQGGQGAMQLDVRALTSTISVAVAQAVKDAMAAHQATVSSTVMPTPTPSAAVEQVVQNEFLSYTTGTIEQAPLPPLLGVGDQPSHPFSSIAVNLGSRDALKLMKYCEVVRDLANKSGDWIFYDEQFRYLRQSSAELYPWDQIHWELWLRAMTNFRAKSQSFTGSDRTTPRG
ncbi:unnamed protein product [Porites evermanni]|uniref:Uncharacterized protein n=1 Tax=Porites evermanni TaxID=104178 RepID=A0ABN8STL4_9CNID|nr:unnamed protein product [Porites evermanni]